MNSKAYIVATIGVASDNSAMFQSLVASGLDVVRLNFSWGDLEEKKRQIQMVREVARQMDKKIPIIADLPGPRVQNGSEHTYDSTVQFSLTEKDKEFLKFCIQEKVEYVALSFVASSEDILLCRKIMEEFGMQIPIIAKIERKVAFENLDGIIAVSDAVMVARGDLGNEFPLEQIPFVQDMIIKKCKHAGKPVITATQMLLTMTENPTPTRAEVTDVANAILQGSDAVMLSEETAKGNYPKEAVSMMEKIVLEAEKHLAGSVNFNSL